MSDNEAQNKLVWIIQDKYTKFQNATKMCPNKYPLNWNLTYPNPFGQGVVQMNDKVWKMKKWIIYVYNTIQCIVTARLLHVMLHCWVSINEHLHHLHLGAYWQNNMLILYNCACRCYFTLFFLSFFLVFFQVFLLYFLFH